MTESQRDESRYVFDQAKGGDAERDRLTLLQSARDAHTIRCLEASGVGPGWRCPDVGAGGGSIARWLGGAVGPSGHVVATDVEIDALGDLRVPNVEVVRHDILVDDLPAARFDLVHVRFVLIHLPRRQDALARLVSAVRPGGWLMVGDSDLRTAGPARPNVTFERVWAAFLATVTSAAADIGYGERIPTVLESQGLVEVEASGERGYWPGGSRGSQLYIPAIQRLREEMTGAHLVTDEDIDTCVGLLSDPAFAWWSGTDWTGWGRKSLGFTSD